MGTIGKYLSMVKFSHSVFAMPFAVLGFFYAVHSTQAALNTWLLLKVLLCMVFARNAAMGFNRWLDRDVDLLNPRTAMREVPAGIISANAALWFVIANAVAFAIITFTINRLCFALSPVALTVILGYSFTKRFTALCHLVLGLGLSLAPIGAYVAVTGHFHPSIILLGATVMLWVSGFDIIYALQDDVFDREHRLHSIPSKLGRVKSLNLSRFLHVLSINALVLFGNMSGAGMLYFAGLLIFLGLLIYQHSIVKPNDLSRVNLAFGTTNGVASILFATLAIADLYIRW